MTPRKHLAQRRAKNLDLGKRDMANRCPICKRVLPALEQDRWFSAIDDDPYCSEDCVGIAEERAKAVVL